MRTCRFHCTPRKSGEVWEKIAGYSAPLGKFTRWLLSVLLLCVVAAPAAAGRITGTATYRERMLLPPESVFEASIEEVSRADAPSAVIANTHVESPQVPITFAIDYDDASISKDRRYVVQARITLNGTVVFTTDTAYPVLGGQRTHVDMMLRRAGSTGAAPLENTYWKLTALHGAAIAPVDRQHEASLMLDPAQNRVAGSGGCNRLVGTYALNGDHVSFGQMAGTMMACAQGMELEQKFLQTLPMVTGWRIVGQRLDLLDEHGNVLAQFEAGAMP